VLFVLAISDQGILLVSCKQLLSNFIKYRIYLGVLQTIGVLCPFINDNASFFGKTCLVFRQGDEIMPHLKNVMLKKTLEYLKK